MGGPSADLYIYIGCSWGYGACRGWREGFGREVMAGLVHCVEKLKCQSWPCQPDCTERRAVVGGQGSCGEGEGDRERGTYMAL